MHELATALVAADPGTARAVGVPDPTTGAPSLRLPATDPAHHAEMERLLQSWQAPVTAPAGDRTWLEEQCIQAEVAVRLHEVRVARPWARAPYWYAEALGDALTAVDPDRLGKPDYAQAYLTLLHEAVAFLATGQDRLDPAEVPPGWAAMAVPAVQGLSGLVETDLGLPSSALPGHLVPEADLRRQQLAAAIDRFADRCRELAETGEGQWAIGEADFDGLLRDYHRLDLTADQVWEHGWRCVEDAQERLVAVAAALDPDRSWAEQVEELKAQRTPAGEFVTAYRRETAHSLQLTRQHDLLTIPGNQDCVVAPLPEFRRAGLPLGEMRTVPPYASELTSFFLITEADAQAPPERIRGHERDNCSTFIRSIVGHETYPGHHIQSVHHIMGTSEDSFLRFFRTPLFVEGWGLYVEDILEETVFGTSTQALFAGRNRLWRSLRLVIDTGLHTGRLTHAEAVGLLMERTGMDGHMARGEVDRYTRHDNPTYPSTYVLGRDELHRLRARLQGRFANLGRLHDALLAHGSPPVTLLEQVLLRAD